jgi:hypothetical protein
MTMKRVKYRTPGSIKTPWQRPTWVIPAVWIGLGLLIGGGIILLLANNQPNVAEVSGSPRGVLSQEHFDYGDVKLGSWVQTDFTIRNVGDQPLHILNQPYIEVVEGCCPPEMTVSSTRLNPGETATVSTRFMMHGSMGGKHDFLAHVLTDDPAEPDKQVHILSNWVG